MNPAKRPLILFLQDNGGAAEGMGRRLRRAMRRHHTLRAPISLCSNYWLKTRSINSAPFRNRRATHGP